MRIRVLSDMHLECVDERPALPGVDADVVVLAGDIHRAAQGVEWAGRQFSDVPVVYVAGNHEFYGGELLARRRELADVAQQWGVHLLDNDSVELQGVRFLGTTLWTDFALYAGISDLTADAAMSIAAQHLLDFRVIEKANGVMFSPADARQLHQDAVHWLEQALAKPFAGPTVVVSHHAPLASSIPPQFRGDSLSPAFASALEHLMGRMALWIHGHVHDPVDLSCQGTRVVANPGGYPGEFSPPRFRADWVVEV